MSYKPGASQLLALSILTWDGTRHGIGWLTGVSQSEYGDLYRRSWLAKEQSTYVGAGTRPASLGVPCVWVYWTRRWSIKLIFTVQYCNTVKLLRNLTKFLRSKRELSNLCLFFTLVQYVHSTSVQSHLHQLLNQYFTMYFHKYESLYAWNTRV